MKFNLHPELPILLVDDEEGWLCSLELMLARQAGLNHTISCSDSCMVMDILARQEFTLMLLDFTMPKLSAEELLPMIARDYPDLPVIILTGRDHVDTAVTCMKLGAADYFIKTEDELRLLNGIQRILHLREVEKENSLLKSGLLAAELKQPELFTEIISQSAAMEAIFHYVEAVAGGNQPVLIRGESGTGKELIVNALHKGGRHNEPLLAINVAGIDEETFADTLFGHERGAYPGADKARKGLIDKAAGGTLFLDEIGSLSEVSQLKLLRVLQDGEFFPVGSDRPRRSRARFVVATNQDLKKLVQEGRFRSDLYYRLKVHQLEIPPLRDRLDDVPLLLDHFLEQAAEEFNKKKPTPPAELAVLLQTYHYPGNVRELKSMVYDAVSQHRQRKISMDAFKKAMGRTAEMTPDLLSGDLPQVQFGEQLPTLKQTVSQLLLEAMKRTKGNQTMMATMLGLSRPALSKRLKKMREEDES